MILREWEQLPEWLKNAATRRYYDTLRRRKFELFLKRVFDFIVAGILLVLLSPALILTAILVKATSKGPVLYKQERLTTYGRKFKIFKFRTMIENADKLGSLVTLETIVALQRWGAFCASSAWTSCPSSSTS